MERDGGRHDAVVTGIVASLVGLRQLRTSASIDPVCSTARRGTAAHGSALLALSFS